MTCRQASQPFFLPHPNIRHPGIDRDPARSRFPAKAPFTPAAIHPDLPSAVSACWPDASGGKRPGADLPPTPFQHHPRSKTAEIRRPAALTLTLGTFYREGAASAPRMRRTSIAIDLRALSVPGQESFASMTYPCPMSG